MSRTRNALVGGRRGCVGLVLGTVALLGVSVSAAPAKPSPRVVRVSSDPYTRAPGQHRTEVEQDTLAHHGQVVEAVQVGRVFGGGATSIGWVTSRDGARHVTSRGPPGPHQGRRWPVRRCERPDRGP